MDGYPILYVFSFRFLKSIPKDYYEAAMIEGAGSVRVFFTITVPIIFRTLLPTLIMDLLCNLIILGFIYLHQVDLWRNLGAPGATDLLITYVYNLAYNTKNYSLAAAYSVIIFVFVAAFSLITMRISNKKFNEGK